MIYKHLRFSQSIFRHSLIWLFVLYITVNQSFAQSKDNFPDSLHKKRFIPVTVAAATWYVGSLTFLSQAWYKDQQKTKFHFFNDNDEWLQMDKLGHGITSYYEGMYGYRMLRWSGVSEKKAIWFGGTFGQDEPAGKQDACL